MTAARIAPVALTCGDPAGIGPELAVHAMDCGTPFIWVGDPSHLPSGTLWHDWSSPAKGAASIPVAPVQFPVAARAGNPDPANARGVITALRVAVEMVQNGDASALCTAPIAKHILQASGEFPFPGHTEFLAHLAGNVDVAMMLASTTVTPPLRVVPATIHIALSAVPDALNDEVLETAIRLTHAALQKDFGISSPRLAVAGLNPHAGESGTMGREELEWMAPLVARLRADGLEVTGPLPADTMFHAPARARYDAAICAYHDQGLIPIKTLDFSGGVNVTLGLPFVRTSPDHGTAFDIAGRGIADPTSLIAALRMASDMAARRV